MRRLASAILVLVLLSACSPGKPLLRPVHRLVEENGAEPPTQTLDHETRYVLRAYPPRNRLKRRFQTLDGDRVAFRHLAGPEEIDVGRAVVVPRVRVGGAGRWTDAAPTVVPVPHGYMDVELQSPLPPQPGMEIFLETYAPASSPEQVETTRPRLIPADATLEFGIALPRAAQAGQPVEFAVELCEAEDCDTIFSERVEPGTPPHWEDRSVSLADHAGRTVALRFRTRAIGGDDAFSFPLWADPTIYEKSTRREGEYDIILISLDTVRADHLTPYGFERDTTPFLNEHVAKRGTLFESCVAPASTTGPSHMTLLTSLQPLVHGIIPKTPGSVLAPRIQTLPALLREHGFDTGAVTENGPIAAERGFARGFAAFRENKETLRGRKKIAIGQTLRRAREWLDRQKDKRFFLFLHTYEAHTPYEPPDRFKGFFLDQPYDSDRFGRLRDQWQPIRYDQELRYTDEALAAFIRILAATGRLDHTIIVLTSDHGEAFLEHGFLFHGVDLHEEVVHVPLMVFGAGIPEGRRIDSPVGLIDVLPTLLELAGAPASAQATGRSLAPLIRGEPSGVDWRSRPLFSEAWQTKASGSRIKYVEQPTFAVRRGSHKLIRSRKQGGFRYAFYDLERDPGEKANRYHPDLAPARELRELIDLYEPTSLDLARRLADEKPLEEVQLDPEREEKLRALGYLD